ncbi:MAG: hypothetical protein LAO21_04680 [Acidobacteriia bacterium]|nr:hypothetical protein [Terriglobia bacterium]
MFHKIFLVLKNALFWRYARGTWQYDLMVAAILLFIFFTPRRIFHDEPLPLNVSDTVIRESHQGSVQVYHLRAQVFSHYKEFQSDNQALTRVIQEELQKNLHRSVKIQRIEPVFDEDQKLEGFRVWVFE